jgi:Rpp14/Pop5 family
LLSLTHDDFLNFLVRFCDSTIRIALIRVPREYCQVIRAAITLLTETRNKPIVVTTLSVKGSARTAKIDAIRQVRWHYRIRLNKLISRNRSIDERISKNTRKDIDRLCQSMEDTLQIITNIDF